MGPQPYFTGQIKEICGCYYPDFVLLGDDLERNVTVFHCVTHGEITIPINRNREKLPLLPVPTDS